MAERTNIPSSPACGLWETLLADALDGLLRPEDEAIFSGAGSGSNSCPPSRKSLLACWIGFLPRPAPDK
jgi:hypothetical protein